MNAHPSARQWVGFVLLALGMSVLLAGTFALVVLFLSKSCGYGC